MSSRTPATLMGDDAAELWAALAARCGSTSAMFWRVRTIDSTTPSSDGMGVALSLGHQ